MRISIDGPSGAGKTSIAKDIAAQLDIQHIDTGAMYRAIALKLIQNNIEPDNDDILVNVAQNSDIKFLNKSDGDQTILLDNQDVSLDIRTSEISDLASKISTFPKFRETMVNKQRTIAEKYDSVLDGRDIGSVVLPDAEFKFYITASPEIRAERRMKQIIQSGDYDLDYDAEYKKTLSDIKNRDERDMNREHSPLIIPNGATVIDNSNLSEKETINKIISIIKGKKAFD